MRVVVVRRRCLLSCVVCCMVFGLYVVSCLLYGGLIIPARHSLCLVDLPSKVASDMNVLSAEVIIDRNCIA